MVTNVYFSSCKVTLIIVGL